MKTPEKIYLFNRYGDINTLDRIKKNLFKLNLCEGHTRIGFNNNIINFIDPSGGPFMQRGECEGFVKENDNNRKIKFIIKEILPSKFGGYFFILSSIVYNKKKY